MKQARQMLIGGMGGSALPGHALSYLGLDAVVVHESYGLPSCVAPDALAVAISNSGNTEETLSFAQAATARGLELACVAAGGALLEYAETNGARSVRIEKGMPTRNALGHLLSALLEVLGETELRARVDAARADVPPLDLSPLLSDQTPVVYATDESYVLGYIALVFLTEAAKIPAFLSLVPHANHYEIQSFDPAAPHAAFAKSLAPTFLTLKGGAPQFEKRQAALYKLLTARGYDARVIDVDSTDRVVSLISFWKGARDATAAFARAHGLDPDTQPLTEEFKKLLS